MKLNFVSDYSVQDIIQVISRYITFNLRTNLAVLTLIFLDRI